jgi:hypothetical protein
MNFLYKHVGPKKVDKNIVIDVKKGIGIIQKFENMPRTRNCLLPTIVDVLLPKLQMGW